MQYPNKFSNHLPCTVGPGDGTSMYRRKRKTLIKSYWQPSNPESHASKTTFTYMLQLSEINNTCRH